MFVALVFGQLIWAAITGGAELRLAPAAIDNPLKGLVPYQGRAGTNFPCSLEFNYLPLRRVVTGLDTYNWEALDNLLNDIASRGRQSIFRFYLEYPGQPSGLPSYLASEGVKITEWRSNDSGRLPNYTPDYTDPRLRRCVTNFIHALGQRYDGDPRIGYITAGLLGLWGEWHDYPRNELWADKRVQNEVLDAYEAAFHVTRILLRYPAGPDESSHPDSARRPMGYHDDSFAYATLDDHRPGHEWYFMPLLARANLTDVWKRQPIGGEVRPEIWGCCYDEPGCEPEGQSFADCVEQTHVTWLMDSGAFRGKLSPERQRKAERLASLLGYEFHVRKADIVVNGDRSISAKLQIINRGVAPFYYPWPVTLAVARTTGEIELTADPQWDLTALAPGKLMTWNHVIQGTDLPPGEHVMLLRVANPMPGGRDLRFANVEQDSVRRGWLSLGRFSVR